MRGTFALAAFLIAASSPACAPAQQSPPAQPTPTEGSAAVNQGQGAASTAGGRTVWDGVYTPAQADRGQKVAQERCFSCHSANDWTSPVFVTIWAGRPIRDMYDHIRSIMPYDAPGSLKRTEYADILSYMLELNNVPAGEVELPSEDAALAEIAVTPAKTP